MQIVCFELATFSWACSCFQHTNNEAAKSTGWVGRVGMPSKSLPFLILKVRHPAIISFIVGCMVIVIIATVLVFNISYHYLNIYGDILCRG